MKKKTLSSIAIILLAYFHLCYAENEEYVAIEKALSSFSNIVVKYHREFDTKVQFVQLQEAIDTISESMLDYEGTAKAKLSELKTLSSAAHNTYTDCVGPVFEWCVSLNRTLDVFIPYIGDPSMTTHDRDIIWRMTVKALGDGQLKTYNSLELLKVVHNKTTDLKNLLDVMLHDLHDDFGPNGYYGKRRLEILKSIELQSNQTINVAIAISRLFGVVVSLLLGQVGLALGFLALFIELGLEDVVRQQRKASYEEELRVIQTFFNLLDDKINNATLIATQVNVDLEEDKRNLHALSGYITAADNNKQLLLSDSKTLRAKLVPSFQDLGAKCYAYTVWHGYNSKGYKHRVRRQATQYCYKQRSKALKMLTERITPNATLNFMMSKAHEAIHEINCHPNALPIVQLSVKSA